MNILATLFFSTTTSIVLFRWEFCSVQLLSHVWLFVTPWTAAQGGLSFTIVWSLLKPMSIESVMPSNHLILCRPLLLPSVFPSIRVFSNESALRIRWPKYWSFSISPSNKYSELISFRVDCFDLLAIRWEYIIFLFNGENPSHMIFVESIAHYTLLGKCSIDNCWD